MSGQPTTWSVADASGRCVDPHGGLQALIDVLRGEGYHVIGPVVRDGVIVHDELTSESEMPEGIAVEQAPGRWRLVHGSDHRRFAWTPAADSFKRAVFPPRREVVRVRRTDGTFVAEHHHPVEQPLALIGIRDCDVRALAILDRVLIDPQHPDPQYAARRAESFVVAVTCGAPSATCWCTSMGGGPQPRDGFDLRITELVDDDLGHRLLVEPGTQRGAEVLAHLPGVVATPHDVEAAARVVHEAVDAMPVRTDGPSLPKRLAGTDMHSHWDVVAERCLSCGNCTLVCPTCFCSSFADRTALSGAGDDDIVVREQVWASCFELDHSWLGGHPVRATTAHRYRQWLTHKLQTWPAQFGTAGCVGCGRCTTWCPAAIDLVEEALALTEATA